MRERLQDEFERKSRKILQTGNSRTVASWRCYGLRNIFDTAVDKPKRSASTTDAFNGSVLSPYEAQECLTDPIRTIRFIQGGYAAIKAAMQKFSERPIRVLEAGSGPYAALSMVLASMFKEGEVEFIALDYFQESVDCAKKVAQVLGQDKKYGAFERGDATQISLEALGIKPPHVVLCETMTAGLQVEPQIAMTANLADQMVKGGFFIPEEVAVTAFLTKIPSLRSYNLGDLYVLTKDVSDRVKRGGEIDPEALAAEQNVDVEFPLPFQLETAFQVVTETRVKVFDSIVIEPMESAITTVLDVPVAKVTDEVLRKANAIRIQTTLGTDGSPPALGYLIHREDLQ